MIANDKLSQTPAEFNNVTDNTSKVVFGMNVQKGNKLLLAIYDPTQLQPIRGRQFMVSPYGIPCYKIISIKNSVRTKDDNFSGFYRLLEKVIKNLLIIHSYLMDLNDSLKTSYL